MSAVELTVTVQNPQTVRVEDEHGGSVLGGVDPDPLRRDTIEVFEDWLSRGTISRREELMVLGQHLFQLLFNGQVEIFFEKTLARVPKGERLRVQLSFQEEANELARLPWEYLYHPRPPFWFSTHVDLVLSRYMPLPTGRSSLAPAESPLRLLIMVSEPKDGSLGPVVAEPVIEAIEKLKERLPIEIIRLQEPPTRDRFVDVLAKHQPHVLHFIGHGRFDRKAPTPLGQIALLMPGGHTVDWCRDQDFAEFFTQARARPRLVFLHLCEGAVADFNANFAGLAPQLMQKEIQAVVAMQYPITNMAAIQFSRAFYEQLAEGEPIDKAVQVARYRLTTTLPQAYDSRIFGTPVLYMHSYDGIIQPATGSGTGGGAPGGGGTAGASAAVVDSGNGSTRTPAPGEWVPSAGPSPSGTPPSSGGKLPPLSGSGSGHVGHPHVAFTARGADRARTGRLAHFRRLVYSARKEVNSLALPEDERRSLRERLDAVERTLVTGYQDQPTAAWIDLLLDRRTDEESDWLRDRLDTFVEALEALEEAP